jgi:hypothetical protein
MDGASAAARGPVPKPPPAAIIGQVANKHPPVRLVPKPAAPTPKPAPPAAGPAADVPADARPTARPTGDLYLGLVVLAELPTEAAAFERHAVRDLAMAAAFEAHRAAAKASADVHIRWAKDKKDKKDASSASSPKDSDGVEDKDKDKDKDEDQDKDERGRSKIRRSAWPSGSAGARSWRCQ